MYLSLFFVISTLAISTFFGFSFWATGIVLDGNTQIHTEHGLIENIQASIIVISFIVYLIAAVFNKKSEKLILCFCVLMCYTFFLREVTIWKLDVPNALKMIGSGIGRDLSISIGFAAIFIYAILRDYSYYKTAAVKFIRSTPGLLLVAAAVFFFIGLYFERQSLMIHHQFYEEMCELFGYVLVLLSSFATIPFLKKPTIRLNYLNKA